MVTNDVWEEIVVVVRDYIAEMIDDVIADDCQVATIIDRAGLRDTTANENAVRDALTRAEHAVLGDSF